jgi:hypothetical protein
MLKVPDMAKRLVFIGWLPLVAGVIATAPVVAQSRPTSPDGYNQLPSDLKGVSMAALVAAGLVKPVPLPQMSAPQEPLRPQAPNSSINWENPINISDYPSGPSGYGSNEPFAALHPTKRNFALVGGNYIDDVLPYNVRVEQTSNFGAAWTRQFIDDHCADSAADGVPTWLGQDSYPDDALYVTLCEPTKSPYIRSLSINRSTDAGVTWSIVKTATGDPNLPGLNDTENNPDRPMLSPAGPTGGVRI